jgi:hypothetical protein
MLPLRFVNQLSFPCRNKAGHNQGVLQAERGAVDARIAATGVSSFVRFATEGGAQGN